MTLTLPLPRTPSDGEPSPGTDPTAQPRCREQATRAQRDESECSSGRTLSSPASAHLKSSTGCVLRKVETEEAEAAVRHWRRKRAGDGGERGDGGRLPRRGRHDPPRRRRPGGASPCSLALTFSVFGPLRFDLCEGEGSAAARRSVSGLCAAGRIGVAPRRIG